MWLGMPRLKERQSNKIRSNIENQLHNSHDSNSSVLTFAIMSLYRKSQDLSRNFDKPPFSTNFPFFSLFSKSSSGGFNRDLFVIYKKKWRKGKLYKKNLFLMLSLYVMLSGISMDAAGEKNLKCLKMGWFNSEKWAIG